MKSLNSLSGIRKLVVGARLHYLRRFWRMDIDPSVQISLRAHLDKTYPCGIHVGRYSYLAFGSTILTHDRTRRAYRDTRIGENVFVGARSIILPGVTVGDGSIVAAGAVVTKNVPPRSMVAGNPATVIKRDVETTQYGMLVAAEGLPEYR